MPPFSVRYLLAHDGHLWLMFSGTIWLWSTQTGGSRMIFSGVDYMGMRERVSGHGLHLRDMREQLWMWARTQGYFL